jgi:RNA polymerase sigma-70 factor, ECF subfamily
VKCRDGRPLLCATRDPGSRAAATCRVTLGPGSRADALGRDDNSGIEIFFTIPPKEIQTCSVLCLEWPRQGMVVRDRTDQDLAARAAGGCAAAFAALLERHYDRIYRVAWRLLGRRAEAEDIAQDVCVKLASAIRGWRGEAEFATWVYRIAYNRALDELRSRQRVVTLPPSNLLAMLDTPAEDAIDAIEQRELWDAVRSLPGQQRDAVLLVYGEDLNHAEAARVMSCSEKTVSWHLHEARKRLKVMLEPVD